MRPIGVLEYPVFVVRHILRYGAPGEVLAAVSSYGSLSEVDKEINLGKEEIEGLAAQKHALEQELKSTEAKLSELQKPIGMYQKALELGFGEKELNGLANLANKHGGPKAILKAVGEYASLSEIKAKVANVKAELNNLEAKSNALEAKYAHLKAGITLCETLIYDHNMGLDAIVAILSIAGKYGQPIDVLKALDAYGSVKTLTGELEKLKAEVQEREKLLKETEGQYEAALEQLGSLNALAMKTGAEVAKVESRLQESKELHKVISLINDPASASYNEYGPLLTAMAASIRKWVGVHEQRFKYPHSIKSGLDDLIKELGDA